MCAFYLPDPQAKYNCDICPLVFQTPYGYIGQRVHSSFFVVISETNKNILNAASKYSVVAVFLVKMKIAQLNCSRRCVN